MKGLFLAILLVSVVFISGCTMPGGVGEEWCQSIGLCPIQEAPVETHDIVIIKKIEIHSMSEGKVRPNRNIDVEVTLKNKDTTEPVKLTYVGIANKGIFLCVDCIKNEEHTINPGQEKTYIFTIKSPEIPDILIPIESEIEVDVKYKYDSSRLVTVSYISEEEYKNYLESGGSIQTSIIDQPSSGPIRLDLDISQIKQPIIIYEEEDLDKQTNNIYLEIKNIGSEQISRAEIDEMDLILSFPEDIEIKECSDEFECDDNKAKNKEAIPLYGGKVLSKYYFVFYPSNNLKYEVETSGPIVTPKSIKATVHYTYTVGKTKIISVSEKGEI